jgi:hypothetical protein
MAGVSKPSDASTFQLQNYRCWSAFLKQDRILNITALIQQLDELEENYQDWVAPINQVIKECSFKVNRDGYTPADFDRDVRTVREKQLEKGDPIQPIHNLLDELCPAYLSASPEEREQVRDAASDKNGVLSALLGYAYRAASQLKSPDDKEWLLNGLAAISIENCGRDYRDVLLALAELYVKAEEVGIKPRSAFTTVSRLSSDEKPDGGDTSMQVMMARLTSYAVLKERRRKGKSSKKQVK